MSSVKQCDGCDKIAVAMTEVKVQVTAHDPSKTATRMLQERAYTLHVCRKECALPAFNRKVVSVDSFTEY